MLIAKMAAEFQGFARDLHDESVQFLAASVASGKPRLSNVLQVGMSISRGLNRNNAGADTLAQDFARIGLIFWPAITSQEPNLGPRWQADLKKLIETRNAIVHDDKAKLLKLESSGFRIDRKLTKNWHDSLDQLAATMMMWLAATLEPCWGCPGRGRRSERSTLLPSR
jgi:hypothetical protein